MRNNGTRRSVADNINKGGLGMFRIFIGWDSRESEVADILRYSFEKHTSIPLEIEYIKKDELVGYNEPITRPGATEFSYTRFLVPWLCGYKGRALFVDCDMVCYSDIAELAQMDMTGLALRVVKHDQDVTSSVKMDGQKQYWYPRKNWSSLMLMDCTMLHRWTPNLVATAHGSYLHQFMDIPDAQIGDLDCTWNDLDHKDGNTKIWHLTSGGPWFKEQENCPHASDWVEARDEYRNLNES